jgi:hypothetical protein
MKNRLIKKWLIFVTIIFYIGASVIPNIGGYVKIRSKVTSDKNIFLESFLAEERGDKNLTCLCNGLVGYWNFNEGKGNICLDKSGCRNDGLINGSIWTKGKVGKALIFDGIDDYIEIQDDNSLDLTNNITVSAWINASSIQNTTNPRIICKYIHPDSGYSFNIDADDSEHNLLFEFRDINSEWYGVHGISSLNDEKWHHVAGTYNGKTISVYVDGILENFTNISFQTKINNNSLRIGHTPNIPENQVFRGVIDEVRIYNRSLSEEEIRYIYLFPGLRNSYMFGFINNLTSYGPYSTFEAKSLIFIRIFPLSLRLFTAEEEFVLSNCCSFGIIRPSFIFGNFKVMERR